MTRLQKYNQIVLALAGTAVLGGMLFLLGAFLVKEVFRTSPVQHEILDEKQLAADREVGIRRQKATFTPATYHLTEAKRWNWSPIEVGVKTLEKPEELDKLNLQMARMTYRKDYSVSDVTNLILWNRETSESRLLFDQRVQISGIIYHGTAELDHILIIARPTDERKEKLYYYSVSDEELSTIDTANYLLHEFDRSNYADVEDITLVSLAVDENGNEKFDYRQEITIPFRFDPYTKSLQPLAPDALLKRAQQILDGATTE